MPNFDLERKVIERMGHTGFNAVCGIDEVGVGALAGPLVAGAVVLDPSQSWISELRDSKELDKSERNKLYIEIKQKAVYETVAAVGADVIDRKGIAYARKHAMSLCFKRIQTMLPPTFTLAAVVDGRFMSKYRELLGGQASIFADKADKSSLSVAAASILAKVTRDDYMTELGLSCPGYDWCYNVGYPTARHMAALKELGPTPFHRKSFKGVAPVESNEGKT